MTNKTNSNAEGLDRVGRLLTNAATLSDAEIDEIAQRPFLFGRVQVRIASEMSESQRPNLLAEFWAASKLAIPAMMLIAALSYGLSVYVGNKTTNSAFSVDAYLGTSDSGMENVVFAERRPLTRDEVLATIIARDEREAGR